MKFLFTLIIGSVFGQMTNATDTQCTLDKWAIEEKAVQAFQKQFPDSVIQGAFANIYSRPPHILVQISAHSCSYDLVVNCQDGSVKTPYGWEANCWSGW